MLSSEKSRGAIASTFFFVVTDGKWFPFVSSSFSLSDHLVRWGINNIPNSHYHPLPRLSVYHCRN